MNKNIIRHLESKDGLYWFAYYIINATPLKRWLSDKSYLTIQFRTQCGYSINWNNPQTFNEKLQWLKLYNRKPEYTMMVDKYDAKKYVASIIGEEYIIPTIGVWDSVDEIDWDSLSNQFVLKCTHDSGGIVVCRDKSKLDKKAAIKKLKDSLKVQFYYSTREWPYKNVKPRVIAEEYLEGSDHPYNDLPDYKFYCFNGNPIYCQAIRDRSTKETIDFYDMDWNLQEFVGMNPKCKNGETPVEKPDCLQDMISICKKLSKDIPFVRVDLYNIEGHIYFGELTFFPHGGMGNLSPSEWNYTFGNWIELPKKRNQHIY